ncbi:septation protein SepH [Kineosporia sp. A_224]|uniref:septation protein SepH n=1 Tax=Kineosporia sp. A_224 TaxID=1962180 RepID=UPI000B4BEC75|nr:septation protein SepH [Kineosporia sp. A_224]
MQDLTLVGVHDDGEHLVLSGADGQRFRVRVDEPLRAAVRRDRARLGQLQIEMDGRMRPRDIQARIRAGHTAQEVADEAGLPLEHVERFEGPVLAEREFVSRQARGVRVRRPGAGTQPTLGELVSERLARREVEDDAAVWDAFRRDDGQWVVTLTFPAGGRTRAGSWTFDPQLRHVSPLDDEARWLTEDDAPEPGVLPPGARRLAPVPDPLRPTRATTRDVVYDVESDGAVRPGGDADAPERAERGSEPRTAEARTAEQRPAEPRQVDVRSPERTSDARRPEPRRTEPREPDLRDAPVRESRPDREPAARTGTSTLDLLDSLRERRGRRQRLEDGTETTPDTDDPVEAFLARADELGEPPAAHPPRSRPELAGDAEVLRLPDADPDRPDDEEPGALPEPVSSRDEPLPKAAGAGTAGAGSRKNRRASVPSWDDIVFGSRRE